MSVNDYLYYVILPLLAFAVLLTSIRFMIGPKIADRVIALDLLLITGIGIISVYSIYTDQPTFLDIAMIMALIAFLSTVAYSYYLEKREKNE